jgi:hypothetical protein
MCMLPGVLAERRKAWRLTDDAINKRNAIDRPANAHLPIPRSDGRNQASDEDGRHTSGMFIREQFRSSYILELY